MVATVSKWSFVSSVTQKALSLVKVFDLQPCPLNKRLCQIQAKPQIHFV